MKNIWIIFFIVLLTSCASVNNVNENYQVQVVSDFLNRIGGEKASERFVTILDESISEDEKDVFVITSKDNKPCIKGSSTLAMTTGINWYLNHYAHINLSWSQLTINDLAKRDLPLPSHEERRVCSADYRYYLNYCTFSYSMSVWTWERWEKEIDWMALHGINMPLQIVGLDVVWKRLLTEFYDYASDEANAFIAGPCFQAWWGMNNLEGWGGPNPDWWYERQAVLSKKICDRMRELGMQPVLPGFSGMVPSNFTEKTGNASNSQGLWCGFKRPNILNPNTDAFKTMAANYYKILEEVMGSSTYYSMDPFHEGANTHGIDVANAYKAIAEAMFSANDDIEEKWVIQYWQWNADQYKVLDQVEKGDLIILDLFSTAHTHFEEYKGHEAVYCMLPNFGGRSGFMGRFNGVIDGYFANKDLHSNIKGIGATPEAIGYVPVLYDVLFELPWYEKNPDAKEWMRNYTISRYGEENELAQQAWELLRKSALNCTTQLQGPHEAVICARPSLTVDKVSSWGGTDIFYDYRDVREAARLLLESDLNGNNYHHDLVDISRQAMTDYAYYLLKDIKDCHDKNDNNDKENYEKLYNEFLSLILDLDTLLGTDKNFMLGTWTGMARSIVNDCRDVSHTSEIDMKWLEFNNARTLITTWGEEVNANQGGLRDYSYRAWSGMLRAFYYPRWKYFFEHDLQEPEGGWFKMERQWALDSGLRYSDEPQGDAKEFLTIKKRTIQNDALNTY
ncbi:MAG: alpha-N-acetylglucosaminidase [Bacteroidales bacterium]|nr:alpha-N-acetylglucosaminidase [Bacteroidales bacterium]